MAARKLGEILVAGKLVEPAGLKKALDAQLIFGGRLGTNLLDLGLLDEETLTEALREQKRVEVATTRMLEGAMGEALRLVPASLADRHKAIPFHLEDRHLKVAMLDPLDLIAIDELAFVAGCTVVPYLAPEVRLLYWLERYYGIPRPTRFVRVSPEHGGFAADAPGGVDDAATSGPRVDVTPASANMPALALEDVLGVARGAAITPQALQASTAPPQAVEAVVAELRRRGEDERRRAEARRGPVTLGEAAARLASAEGRDDVGEALVALARESFPRVMAWLVQKDRALGWLGSVEGLAAESARRLARAATASLGDSSVLEEVVASGQYYMGEVPSRPGDARVADAFGAPRPANLLLLPVTLADQVVMVLQCDSAEKPFGEFDLRGLRAACQKAGLAMEVLLLRARIRQG